MDLTAQIALGMIVQETISDFAYKLGKQGQVALEVSDDDGDSERIESDVSDDGDFLTEEDDAVKKDKEAGDAGDRDEEMEDDVSDDDQKGGRDVDDDEEDDGYMSL